ncbi:hypothetical protein [Effusibacillus consociatus]|uniref:Uncharacterized protein n=1 Tax=Effusibacillus consociatus TaxID=1117041 RepID=A0ABV9PXW7_9BACL
MANATPVLEQFWDQTLKTMPKKEVQAFLKEIGVNLPTANLSDDEVRKVLYGFLAQMDESLQESAIEMLRKKE